MVAELFLQEARPVAVGIATIVNWSANFTVGLTFPYILVGQLTLLDSNFDAFLYRNISIRMGRVCLWVRVVCYGSISISTCLKLRGEVWTKSRCSSDGTLKSSSVDFSVYLRVLYNTGYFFFMCSVFSLRRYACAVLVRTAAALNYCVL